MDIKLLSGELQQAAVDALIVGLFENGGDLSGVAAAINTALGGAVKDVLDAGDFTGKLSQTSLLYPRGALPAKRLILVGLGKRDSFSADALRRASASAVQKARDLKAKTAAAALPGVAELGAQVAATAFAEGAHLGLYSYHGQKSSEQPAALPETLEVAPGDADGAAVEAALEVGRALADATRLTRDLANLPPNVCTPEYLADTAQKLADANGLRVEVLHRTQMEALKMGALLSVARGSRTEPKFIVLEHNADRTDLDTIVLVGKGITFDTGGYSIKTADGMVGMKGDMAGAAAVLGAMQAIGALGVPLHVVGLVPTCDNMISGDAYVPQEVITASNGVTIEVISTDAEGRLILADALVYAARFNPAAVVDIATLTGAMSIALGNVTAGFFCSDDKLRDRLVAAGNATQERVWPMPLYPEYEKQLESKTADLKNTGGRPGGACTAAMFLKRFTSYPAWAHIDMAGVMGDVPENPCLPGGGASGFGARLFVEFVKRWAGGDA